MRALSDELDGLSVEELERHAPSYIQGVRVLYDAAGTPQRDETAFRHALKTAHRAHKRGQRLKDAPHHRRPRTRLPHRPRPRHPRPPRRNAPMRDRLTMARRVRAYATTNKTGKVAGTGLSSTQHVTPVERNALRTFGSRGGKATVQRRANNPEEREPLRKGWEKANMQRQRQAKASKAEVLAFLSKQIAESGTQPTRREVMDEFNLSESTAKRYIRTVRDLL